MIITSNPEAKKKGEDKEVILPFNLLPFSSEEKKPESGVSMQEGLQRSRNSREDSGSIIPKKPKIDHTSQMSFLIAFFFLCYSSEREMSN